MGCASAFGTSSQYEGKKHKHHQHHKSKVVGSTFPQDEQEKKTMRTIDLLDFQIHLKKQTFREHLPETTGGKKDENMPSLLKIQEIKIQQAQELLALKESFAKMLQKYNQHDIDLAYKQAAELKTHLHLIQSRKDEFQLSKLVEEQIIASIKMIEEEMLEIIKYEQMIAEGEKWVQKADKNNIKIFIRREENGTVGARIVTVLDIPIVAPMAIITETDLFYQVMPFAEESQLQKIYSRNCRLSWCIINLPFLSKRQLYFREIAYNRLNCEKKQILLLLSSVHNREDLKKKYDYEADIEEGNISLDFEYAIVKYTPTAKNVGNLQITINMDPKVDFLPNFVLELIVQKFTFMLFENIMKLSKKYEGSEWQKKVETHPQTFNYFKKVVDNYVSSETDFHD